MTTRQQKDLETILYFMPSMVDQSRITEEDIKSFFEYSERGIVPTGEIIWNGSKTVGTYGYNALLEGKKWRGIHMGMYEEGILDGSVSYYTLLVEDRPPQSVVDFMKKELFKGVDRELIESIYNG